MADRVFWVRGYAFTGSDDPDVPVSRRDRGDQRELVFGIHGVFSLCVFGAAAVGVCVDAAGDDSDGVGVEDSEFVGEHGYVGGYFDLLWPKVLPGGYSPRF